MEPFGIPERWVIQYVETIRPELQVLFAPNVGKVLNNDMLTW
jgi:hypothetical protein